VRCAIVTGASSGMGREFVLQLDERTLYDEIWVVARRAELLRELQQETRAKIRPISVDLTEDGGMELLEDALRRERPEVLTLVNAAGFGRFGVFREMDIGEQENMLRLNVLALTRVTHLVLPYMRRGGEIYQLGSLSAFQPVPYIGVYGASKAYVLSFSRALNVELKKHGIRCMAVCPGWVRTEFFQRAVRDDTITYYNRYYAAADVVARAIRDMARKKDVSVLGFPIRAQVLAVKLLPHRLVMKIWCRQQKQPG